MNLYRQSPKRTQLLFTLFASAVLLLGVIAQPAAAQVLYGSVVGTVADQSGAVVPGAAVELTNQNTGQIYSGETGAAGQYNIVNVLPGTYDLKVSTAGFRTSTRTGVTVTPNTVTRENVALEVGQVTEQITVEASTAVLQTDKADTSAEIGTKEVENLPLPGFRNYQSLINLVPGATPARFQNSILDTPARSLSTNVNGTNRNNNVTRIDGAASINVWLPHHAGYIAPADTIEVVNITTAAGDAEQGLSGGASTTVITKSGTNNIHGSAFWFHDNQHFKARNYFAADKPVSNFNNYGGTIGGPIKKDKLFYFFSYDRTTQRIGGVRPNDDVPTADQRAGDFSAYLLPDGTNTIYNPYTGVQDKSDPAYATDRLPFPGNIIPSNLLNPISLNIQSYYPLPNKPGTNNNFESSDSPPFARQYIDTKVNYNITDKFVFWGKYGHMTAPVSGHAIFGIAGGPAPGGSPGDAHTTVNLATLGWTYTISPTLLYDGVAGYDRQDQDVQPEGFGTDIKLGIPGIGSSANPDPRTWGFPNVHPGYTGFGAPGWQPLERVEENYTTSQNFTLIKGTHQIRFGFDGILLKLTHWQPELGGGPRGTFDFAGDITALKGGAAAGQYNGYATFLLGEASRMRKSLQWIINSGREWQFAGYVTDRWQVTPKFTVNIGVRYEYFPIMTRARGKGLEVYDPNTNTMRIGGYGSVPKDTGVTASKKQFSPRLGLAYRVNDKTVIRTGYGLNYDPMPFSRPLRGQYPYVPTFDLQRDNSFETFRTLQEGIPPLSGPDLSTGILDVPLTAGFRTPWGGEISRGYIQSWNFTIERQLPLDILTSIAYVGTSSVKMLADRDINAALTGGNNARPFASITGRKRSIPMWDSYLGSNYHSLQVALNKSFSKGLMLKGAYTYSKAINLTNDDGWAGVSWNSPEVFSRNRARAGFDRTQMFQLGFVYELPMGESYSVANSGAAKWILGGWQVSGIVSAVTGTPRTISGSGSSLNTAGNSQTADQVAPVRKIGNYGPGQFYYDPASFKSVSSNEPGGGVRFGTSGRDILDNPGRANLDLSFFKKIPITEKVKAQFRAEFFNFTNHPQFGSFNSSQTSGSFMQVTSASNERNIRLGLRFDF